MASLIKNCRVVSADLDLPGAAVEIEGSLIKRVYAPGEGLPAAVETYDAAGRVLCPGFVDIHTHGAGGRDVTDGTCESIRRIAELKLQEGVTTFAPTTLTLPEAQLAKAMAAVAAYNAKPDFAKVAGVHLEGPFINPKCCGAQNPAFVRPPNLAEVLRLHAISKVAVVTFAAEMEGSEAFIKGLLDNGIVPSCGHSAATHADFLKAKAAGLKHLTHFCNQMSPLHHREIGLVGSGLLDDQVLVEMICDKVHLSGPMVQLGFKARGPEGVVMITDSLAASWMPDGQYSLGGLAFAVKDGEARLATSGALAGSTLKYYAGLKNAAELTRLPLERLIKAAGYNQARSLGLDKVGAIKPGWKADLVVLGHDFTPNAVFVDGVRKL